MKATIYEEMEEAGIPIDSNESDLYVLKTPESERILKEWDHSYTIFVNQIDHKIWYDIPFAYKP